MGEKVGWYAQIDPPPGQGSSGPISPAQVKRELLLALRESKEQQQLALREGQELQQRNRTLALTIRDLILANDVTESGRRLSGVGGWKSLLAGEYGSSGRTGARPESP